MACVQLGVKLATFDRRAQAMGWDLRMAPSTYRTATIGSFIASGSGDDILIGGSGNNLLAGGAGRAADIIYNSSNGNLYYNPNGTDAGFDSGGQFITLPDDRVLSASDFIIQG